MIKGKCRKCGSTKLYFYDGSLGYESIVCSDCDTHHSNEKPILKIKMEEE